LATPEAMNAPLARLQMRRTLAPSHEPVPPGVRPMRADDLAALGTLFYAAYRDTVDHDGESEQEAHDVVQATWTGAHGTLLPEASMVLERDGQLLSAVFVTRWQARPLLAFAITHPLRKGQGLAADCTRAALQALARLGHDELRLFVTPANAPALALYRRLGFEPVADAPHGGPVS
jgi:ribosomal protein S18 acetylase RimI-like enzyme